MYMHVLLCLCSNWQSLESEDLVLGKVSASFLKQNGPLLYQSLAQLAEHLYSDLRNLKAFYKFLFLMTLEFSPTGVLELVLFCDKLQSLALKKSSCSDVYFALHGTVAGLLYLVSKVCVAPALQEHIELVIAARKVSAPFLLPGATFGPEDGADGHIVGGDIEPQLLFEVDEGLLRRSPDNEAQKSFG